MSLAISPEITSRANILVAGDIILDRYWSGQTSRISPEAPVPVVLVDESMENAGGAGNVALNVKALGADSTIVSITGDDEAGAELAGIFTHNGINASLCKTPAIPTSLKLRVLSRHQQLIRMDFEKSAARLDKTEFYDSFKRELGSAQAVILSDYGKGTLSAPQQLITAANRENIPVLVDPKGDDFTCYKNAAIITPNRLEFEAAAGKCGSLAEIEEKAYKLCRELSVQGLLITLSEEGMLLVTETGDCIHAPTRALDVYDVTGAGDTVIAAFAVATASGLNNSQAMEFANTAAGVVVGKLGAATASLEEIAGTAGHKKIVTVDKLKAIIERERKNGGKITMTNGCFDIIHPGHIHYLEEAGKTGDILAVAVNSDQSVARLKGKNRPIQALADRMEVLAGLACVDYVVSFSEDTPKELYCRLLPDVLVKGGDYSEDEVAGGKCVKANGGSVQIVKLVAAKSSSNIINKVRESYT